MKMLKCNNYPFQTLNNSFHCSIMGSPLSPSLTNAKSGSWSASWTSLSAWVFLELTENRCHKLFIAEFSDDWTQASYKRWLRQWTYVASSHFSFFIRAWTPDMWPDILLAPSKASQTTLEKLIPLLSIMEIIPPVITSAVSSGTFCISKKHSFMQPAVVRYCIHTDSSIRFFISVASSPISDKNGEPDISFTVLLSMYSPTAFTIFREVAKDLYVTFPERLLKTSM